MKAIFKIASFFYLTLLLYIFFLARRRGHARLYGHFGLVNLIPFRNKIQHFRYKGMFSVKEQLNYYVDIFGNILLFIPFAVILIVLFNVKSPRRAIFISFITSVCIELIQFLLRLGVADIDDVILNTLGACIGVWLVRRLRKSNNKLVQKTGLFSVE